MAAGRRWDPSREAARGSPRAALELVRQHLSRGALSAEDVDAALGGRATWVRFERGRNDVMGPTFGPFAWVQHTYQDLTVDVGPNGEANATLAYWDADAVEWFLDRAAGEHEGEFYSDVIVFCGRPDGRVELAGHDCREARHTLDPHDANYEVRWDEPGRRWARTGRRSPR